MSTADLDFVPYDPEWPARFAALRTRLTAHLPPGVEVEHVGSTSVPGLASKDCVDVLVVAPPDLRDRVLRAVAAAGLEHRPGSFPDDPDRDFFRLVEGGRRRAHVHVVTSGSDVVGSMLAVRDLLREDTGWRTAYQDLKARLAADHPDDRGGYIAGKDAFMQRLLAAALDAAGPTRPSTA